MEADLIELTMNGQQNHNLDNQHPGQDQQTSRRRQHSRSILNQAMKIISKLSKQEQQQHQSSQHNKKFRSTTWLTCLIAVGVPSAFKARAEVHHIYNKQVESPSFRSTSPTSEDLKINRQWPSWQPSTSRQDSVWQLCNQTSNNCLTMHQTAFKHSSTRLADQTASYNQTMSHISKHYSNQ